MPILWDKGAVLLILLIWGSSWSMAAESLSFTQAWQRILTENDGLKAEQSSVTRAQQLAVAGKSLNLPSLEIQGSAAYVENPPTIAERVPALLAHSASRQMLIDLTSKYPELGDTSAIRSVKSAGVNALWVIYAGGRISAAQEALLADAGQAESLYQLKKQQTFNDLVKFYYGVVLAKNIYITRQEIATTSSQHLRNAERLEQHGQIAKVERLSAQVANDRASVEADNARRDLEIAQVVLDKLLYSAHVEPISPLLPVKPLPALATFLQKTLDSHPSLMVLELKGKQAESLIKAERGRYLPTVAVVGNYNLYKQKTLLDDQKPEWLVGVNVSIPLMDSSGRSDRLAAAHSTRSEVGYRKADTIQQLTIAVEQSYRRVEQARAEYESLRSSEELAQENYRLRSKAFEQGLSNSTDVVDAQTSLAAIQTQREAALYQMNVAMATLLSLTGEVDKLSQYQDDIRLL